MEPTFYTGNYLIVDQLTYRFKDPQRGNVVIFKFPNNESKYLIKRIVGMPGEDFKIDTGEIYIKENKLKDWEKINIPNLSKDEKESLKNTETRLKEDEYFVMGDNSEVSLDSRTWGVLPADFIVGRAFIRLFPFTEISFLPGDIKFSP